MTRPILSPGALLVALWRRSETRMRSAGSSAFPDSEANCAHGVPVQSDS
jgi:hypothetical protein